MNLAYGIDSIDADTLMNTPYPPARFIVDGLLPYGVNLICGAGKIGKSWLMLDLALKVATGEPLWGMKTEKCDVLYLCLEDTRSRIQDRLQQLVDEAPSNLRFSVMARTLSGGLDRDICDYLYMYPETRLIIIDTLQKIRAEKDKSSGSMYANDYDDISILKNIAGDRNVSILLVHHLRKMPDNSDPFNEISGTTGISGAVDSAFLLKKGKRADDTATLYATGRDIEYQEIHLIFKKMRWILIEIQTVEQIKKMETPNYIYKIVPFMSTRSEWSGSATDLLNELGESTCYSTMVSKMIVRYYYEILRPEGIIFDTKRTNKSRLLILRKRDVSDGGECENGIS